MTQTIVVVRRAERDSDGNRPSGVTRIPLVDVFTAPRSQHNWSQAVDARARDGSREELDLYSVDVHVDLRPATDQVEVDGLLYELGGVPARYTNPFTGDPAGSVTALWRAVG